MLFNQNLIKELAVVVGCILPAPLLYDAVAPPIPYANLTLFPLSAVVPGF